MKKLIRKIYNNNKKPVIDLLNQKYGRLLIIGYSHINKHKGSCWLCLCKCGEKKIIAAVNLKQGLTKSCGCLHKEIVAKIGRNNGTHRLTHLKCYITWEALRRRCNCKTAHNYRYYGGRGIKVCKRWNKFENFYADMGNRPKGKSIDRIDNNRDYKPSNCRWATRLQQRRNRRDFIKKYFVNNREKS